MPDKQHGRFLWVPGQNMGTKQGNNNYMFAHVICHQLQQVQQLQDKTQDTKSVKKFENLTWFSLKGCNVVTLHI